MLRRTYERVVRYGYTGTNRTEEARYSVVCTTTDETRRTLSSWMDESPVIRVGFGCDANQKSELFGLPSPP